MEIVHRDFYSYHRTSGGHQELVSQTNSGKTVTIGMVLAGEWSPRCAIGRETIMVTSGSININGQDYSYPDKMVCVVEDGEKINLIALDTATYISIA